jgi:hypothetical protein
MVIKTGLLPVRGETILGGMFFMNAGGNRYNEPQFYCLINIFVV